MDATKSTKGDLDQLATHEEIDQIVRELYEYAADPMTIAGTPRIVQAWGRKPVDQ